MAQLGAYSLHDRQFDAVVRARHLAQNSKPNSWQRVRHGPLPHRIKDWLTSRVDGEATPESSQRQVTICIGALHLWTC